MPASVRIRSIEGGQRAQLLIGDPGVGPKLHKVAADIAGIGEQSHAQHHAADAVRQHINRLPRHCADMQQRGRDIHQRGLFDCPWPAGSRQCRAGSQIDDPDITPGQAEKLGRTLRQRLVGEAVTAGAVAVNHHQRRQVLARLGRPLRLRALAVMREPDHDRFVAVRYQADFEFGDLG